MPSYRTQKLHKSHTLSDQIKVDRFTWIYRLWDDFRFEDSCHVWDDSGELTVSFDPVCFQITSAVHLMVTCLLKFSQRAECWRAVAISQRCFKQNTCWVTEKGKTKTATKVCMKSLRSTNTNLFICLSSAQLTFTSVWLLFLALIHMLLFSGLISTFSPVPLFLSWLSF